MDLLTVRNSSVVCERIEVFFLTNSGSPATVASKGWFMAARASMSQNLPFPSPLLTSSFLPPPFQAPKDLFRDRKIAPFISFFIFMRDSMRRFWRKWDAYGYN
jgi:hypothetical protein